MNTESRLNVLGIVGSLRDQSFNRALLAAAIENAPESLGIRAFRRLGEIPLFNEDIEAQGDPEAVVAFKRSIREADAILIVTPEYNFGVPGVLKNALDWASRPADRSVLLGKPAGIMGASPGSVGTARAQLALRQTFVFTRTPTLLGPEVLVSRVQQKVGDEGRLEDPKTLDHIRGFLSTWEKWIRQVLDGARSAESKRSVA